MSTTREQDMAIIEQQMAIAYRDTLEKVIASRPLKQEVETWSRLIFELGYIAGQEAKLKEAAVPRPRTSPFSLNTTSN